jgi:hypothetical protein
LTVDALPDDVPAGVRWRMWAKIGLRRFGLKIVEAREGAAAASTDEILALRRRVEALTAKAAGVPQDATKSEGPPDAPR